MPSPHVLIVGLDGLRPDRVTPERMPTLWRLMQQGVHFRHHRAVFPTATRVNVASLVTGATAGTHGVVNNSLFVPGLFADRAVDLGKYDVVEAANAYFGGRLLCTPSLGEILAAHGQILAALSAGTTGSNRLMHHTVKRQGGLVFSAHGLAPSFPPQEATAILERFGPPPAAGTPDAARLAYLTTVFLEYVFPVHRPRVTILWFSDPDRTYHYCGIGSPAAEEALRAVDTQLGRLLDWLQQPAQREAVNLIVLSDHGHLTVRHKVDVRAALAAAGFAARHGSYEDADIAVVPWCCGALHVRQPRLLPQVATWLLAQPWCGPLFTPGKNAVEGLVPGTFARALVNVEHPRAADLIYVLRSDEAPDAHGVRGGCYDDSYLPLGGSTHGGLSPQELHSLCVAYGPAFREGYASELPSGTFDLMPTVLHLLGYPLPAGIEGRVLHEALATPAAVELPVETRTYTAEAPTPAGRYRQHLTLTRVGTTPYLERAWVEA
ncbi:MAG: hypothetical protein KatS3mg131_3973 [Candidatus Tectimicrobiota bacterium]|nr:MAG: hypothetical protein KatS3mg131_3973 [Candidatus Tectomicrobia bacterium]